MSRRLAALIGLILLATMLTGCFGRSKSTGKFSNQDKPKPVEPAGK